MTPRPEIAELREAAQEVLARFTTRMGSVNQVALADHVAAVEAELRELEGRWARLIGPHTLEAAARAHYQTASAFSWEKLSTSERALATVAMLAALTTARKVARYGTPADPSEVGDSTYA